MSIRYVLLLLLSLGLLPGCAQERSLVDETPVPAEEAIKPPEGSISEPTPIDLPRVEVEELLEQFAAVFRDARGYAVRGKVQQVALDDNGRFVPGMQSPLLERDFRVEKPNRLRLSAVFEGGPIVVSDGADLVTYVPKSPTDRPFSRQTSPSQMLEIVHNPEVASLDTPMRLFAMHFAADDLRQVLFKGATDIRLVGGEQVDGEPTYHLFVEESSAGFGWHLWLAAEGPPLPRMIRFDTGKEKLVVGNVEREMNVAMFDQFSNWKIDPPEDADVFTFQPPEGSYEMSSLYEVRSPMLGQPAPAFSLARMAGDTLTQDSHLGKDVVVLDFWATWCGPCREQLKLLEAVTEEYAGRGVQFYSVNQGESVPVIERFLEATKFKLNVLLDPRKTAGEAYGANNLPTLVVINRDGKVHAVNPGYHTGLDWVLRKQLDRALKEPAASEAPTSPAAPASDTPPPPPTAEDDADDPSGQP